MLKKLSRQIIDSLKNSARIIEKGLSVFKRNPQIAAYPYVAALFIAATLPLATGLMLGLWNRFWRSSLFSITETAPQNFRILLGIASFSFFYTAFVSAYFSCAASASVLARLEGRPVSFLYGLRQVMKRFFRVTKFATLAIFFFPLGILAQYKKLPKGIFGVISSSFSLQIPQVAPEVIRGHDGVRVSVANVVETFRRVRYEAVIIRISTILVILILGVVAFLPKFIERFWLEDNSARLVGWLASFMLGAVAYITVKVISTVITTTLYYEAKTKK
ncbi:MAG: hypothetical protein WD877_00080 [Candidatus Saccharimonadales bacterium]